jgi:uncharacterized protein (TIGR02246 family)
VQQVQDWLDAYVKAWRANDPAAIGELFAEDATYAYHPYSEPLRGREAIVASWLEHDDAPGSWEASYAALAVAGDRAFATGETRYANGPTYSNLFVMRFDEHGRCRDFVEWFMEQPKEG